MRSPFITIWHFLRLTRPFSLVGAGAEVALGAHLSIPGRAGGCLLLAAIGVALILAFAQVFNDLHDEPLDRLAGKNRPLARNQLQRPHAVALQWVTLISGVVLLLLSVSLLQVATAIALAALSVVYTVAAKNSVYWGNVFAAGLSAAPVLFGGWVAGGVSPLNLVAYLYIVLFLSLYEIVKTVRDRPGDRFYGLNTAATTLSARHLEMSIVAGALIILPSPLLGLICAPGRALDFALLMTLGVSVPTLIGAALVIFGGYSELTLYWSVKWLQLAWFPAMVSFSWMSTPRLW